MLSQMEHSGATIINDPHTIRHNLCKSYLWQLQAKGIRVPVTMTIAELVDRLRSSCPRNNEGVKYLVKPLCNERGNDQCLVTSMEDLRKFMKVRMESDYLAQEFCSCVR